MSVLLIGTLHLRGAGALRILWPPDPPTGSHPLAVIAGEPSATESAARAIARRGAIAVLLPTLAAEQACGWLADHATELGADPATLTLVTVGLSYDAALDLADSATPDGWPPLAALLIELPAGAEPPAGPRQLSHVRSIEILSGER